MAGLENLFAAEPTLPNVQTSKCPDDPQQWAEVVTTKLREQYPEVTRLSMSVEFRKKDPQSGTAIGAVCVTTPENPNKKMFVPVILKKFEMFPLDIWMEAESQNVHPLTNDTFKEVFFLTSIADGLDQRPQDAAGQYFNDPSLWTTNYPPLQGRYSYASAGFKILDEIEDTIRKTHLDLFRASIEKNATSLPKYKNIEGGMELIQKLAKKTPVETNNFADSAKKLIPIGAASIKKEGPDKYSVISMADQLFDLAASEYMSREDCHKFLSKISPKPWELLHEVDQEGEKMVILKKAPDKGVFLYDDIRDKPEAATEFAPYDVKNKAGMHVLGIVFPYVVDFAGKKQSQKLFISPEHSTMQASIGGVKRPDSDVFQKMFASPKGARVGQTGTFIFIDDGKAVATIPVTIKCIEEFGTMTAVTLDGVKIKIKRSWGDDNVLEAASPAMKKKPNFLDAHGMVEVRPKEYVIPKRMTWYPMEGFQEVSHTPQEWLQKEASLHIDMDPLTLRFTGIVYDVSGAGMEKVSLDERRAKLLLATRGATIEKVAQIIKKAREVGRVKVHGLQPLRKISDITKLAEDSEKSLIAICDNLRCDFFKEAAELDDAMTVDALLSLNFINPENLSKFVSYLPVFKKSLDFLAELTLASRLGIKDLNEGALVTVMSRLQEVVEGLKKIESGLKKPGIKTASVADKAHKALTAAGAATSIVMGAKALHKHHKKEAAVSFIDGLNKSAAPAAKAAEKAPAAKEQPKPQSAMAQQAAPAQIPPGAMQSGPKGDNPFSEGMMDGELGATLFIDKWRKDAKAMLQYMNGKRLSEQNKASANMAMGMQPNGKPQPQPKPQAK